MLPGVPRILCLYHIGENIKRHLLSKLGDVYPAFMQAWHKLVHSMRCEDDFERGWYELLDTYEPARDYLSRHVYPQRHHWCRLWTRTYTTFGALTTQRSETVNSVVKYFEEHNSTLQTLFTTILSITQRWVQERETRISRSRYTNHAASGPVYTTAAEHLTREAAERVYTESLFLTDYDVVLFERLPSDCSSAVSANNSARVNYIPHASFLGTPVVDFQYTSGATMVSDGYISGANVVDNTSESGTTLVQPRCTNGATDAYRPHSCLDLPDEGSVYCVRHRIEEKGFVTHWVRVREGSATCTDCHFNTNYLLPCRHILAVNLRRWPKAIVFRLGQCHRRWWLDDGSVPVTLPSSTALIAPLPNDTVSTEPLPSDEDGSAYELSKDGIHRAWIAAAERASGFIQQHGSPGLQYSLKMIAQLISALAAKGPGVPDKVSHNSQQWCINGISVVNLWYLSGIRVVLKWYNCSIYPLIVLICSGCSVQAVEIPKPSQELVVVGKRKREPSSKVREARISLADADAPSTATKGKRAIRCTNATSKHTANSRKKKKTKKR